VTEESQKGNSYYMDLIIGGFKEALNLLVHLDRESLSITLRSLLVSGSAILISLLIGIPIGTLLGLSRFPGKRIIVSLINTGMGVPPVAVGLAVTLFLWRSGPLGWMNLLYTSTGMVIAQVIISLPIVTGISVAAIQNLNPNLCLQTLSLGANKWQLFIILICDARLPILAAIMAGFGSVISEVGAVMMVGGNIKGHTRVLTTAIVTETRMGHFNMAIALCIILLVISFLINLILTYVQQKR